MRISDTPGVDHYNTEPRAEQAPRDDEPSFARLLESAEQEHAPDSAQAEEATTPQPGERAEQTEAESDDLNTDQPSEAEGEVEGQEQGEPAPSDPEVAPVVDGAVLAQNHGVAATGAPKPEAGAGTKPTAIELGRTPRPVVATDSRGDARTPQQSDLAATKAAPTVAATAAGDAVASTDSASALLRQLQVANAPTDVAPAAEATHHNEPPTSPAQPAQTAARTEGSPVSPVTPRFVDPRTLQTLEAQRASVFKQIAMRVTPERGEMRMRLDPPELGHLDLHMVVEKSGSARLQIVAERPEVVAILERHLGELKQTLADQGIDVAEAEIQFGQRGQAKGGLGEPESGSEFGQHDDTHSAEESEASDGIRNPGYITADGLDYWV